MHFHVSAQIDPQKLDSLSRAINSSVKTQRLWQDSFAKAQDSIYHSAIGKNISNTPNSDQFIKEQKELDADQRIQTLLRITIGVSLLAIAIAIFLRKSRTG